MVTGISRFTKGEFSQAALDEVWNKGKELYKAPEAPPSSGFIPNSTDLIWQDMTVNNTVFPATMPSSYGQFNHPFMVDVTVDKGGTSLSPWFEVESQGTGSSCSGDTNPASNTYVEMGRSMAYARINGNWVMVGNTAPDKHGGSRQYPIVSEWEREGCRGDDWSYILQYDWDVIRNTPEGHRAFYPKYGYWFHGWSNRYTPSTPGDVDVYFYTIYMRLRLIDPNGEDDRSTARFVTHAGADWWDLDDEGYIGDIGISRYRSLTSDWQPVNFISEITKEELEANPPPLQTTPF